MAGKRIRRGEQDTQGEGTSHHPLTPPPLLPHTHHHLLSSPSHTPPTLTLNCLPPSHTPPPLLPHTHTSHPHTHTHCLPYTQVSSLHFELAHQRVQLQGKLAEAEGTIRQLKEEAEEKVSLSVCLTNGVRKPRLVFTFHCRLYPPS